VKCNWDTFRPLNFNSSKFLKHRLSIDDFPCYETQGSLDIFTAYAAISNVRSKIVPCIDCYESFQAQTAKKNLCRYPTAKFKVIEGERIIAKLGAPVCLPLDVSAKGDVHIKHMPIIPILSERQSNHKQPSKCKALTTAKRTIWKEHD